MALNEAGNPYRCRCCWDCGDCMPLIYSSPGCPEIASATSCITMPLESWATPTYTAKKRPGESTGIYATAPGTNVSCDCSWQLYQYCIDDAAGTNGRAWVVEGDCHDNVANTTTHFGPTIVRDWSCLCVGARYEFLLTVGGCCCACAPGSECCSQASTLTLTFSSFSNPCLTADIANRTVTLTWVSDCLWRGTIANLCDNGIDPGSEVCFEFECTGTSGTLSVYCDQDCSGSPEATYSDTWSSGWASGWTGSAAACVDYGTVIVSIAE